MLAMLRIEGSRTHFSELADHTEPPQADSGVSWKEFMGFPDQIGFSYQDRLDRVIIKRGVAEAQVASIRRGGPVDLSDPHQAKAAAWAPNLIGIVRR